MRARLLAAALLLASASARASDYEDGMAARRRGDRSAARAAFERLLAADPKSSGALEGLTLVALDEGRHEEALTLLERWGAAGDSAYRQSLKARALARLGREDERIDALLAQGRLEPADPAPLLTADALLRAGASGLFPAARIQKSIAQENLETSAPQRIVYETRSAGASGRARLRDGLAAVGGVSVRQDSQRNDTRGFSYFDVLEQRYDLGLESRARRLRWSAGYGQSLFSDLHGSAAGRLSFSRARGRVEAELRPVTLRAAAERAPYLLRGARGDRFFAVLRETSASLEAESYLADWHLLARSSVLAYSDRTTLRPLLVSARRELPAGHARASCAQGYQEFYGAGVDGRLAVMPYGRCSAGGRWSTGPAWEVSGSYARAAYRDGNHADEVEAEARGRLPFARPLSAVYRFALADFAVPVQEYRSFDNRAHWAGPVWRQPWAAGLWSELEYAHGWLRDPRGDFHADALTARLEWHLGRAGSLTAEGRLADSSSRDESYRASLSARCAF